MNWVGSVFDTAGIQASRIATLAWVLIAVSGVVYVLVIAMLAVAMRRGHRRAATGQLADQRAETERRMARHIVIASGVTTLILFAYVTASAWTGRSIAWRLDSGTPWNLLGGQRPLTIEVTGHQWWWEFAYNDSVPSHMLTTSNELHIPVGRPVQLVLQSNDVIHSFWIPELHGKQDAIPGHKNTMWLRADRPGVWKARCAEFCGHQHAKMQFDVVAEWPARFNQWYVSQLASAREPTDSSARRGQQVFLQNACIMCHTVAGTPAGSRVGPDLTHLASRPSIAAGTLPNVRGNLAGWIVDPQRIKPGVRMPPNQLSPADLNALLDYLESLR